MSESLRDWKWRQSGECHDLRATDNDGQRDDMVALRPLGPNLWQIKTWKRPFAPETMKLEEFQGSLEEAKAYATVLVRLR